MKNESRISVRTLTAMALLIAMSIVFSRVLSISTGFVRFNLGSLPVLLAGILFGPWAGFVVGMVADIIGGVLAGYAINPLITLGAASIGLVGGLGWQKLFHLRTGNRLWCSVLAAHFVGSMVINSLALHIFYGYAWAVLIARIPNALVLTAVNTVLLRILLENRALMAVAKRYERFYAGLSSLLRTKREPEMVLAPVRGAERFYVKWNCSLLMSKENQKTTSDFDALDPRERGCSPLSDPEGVVEAQKC